MAQLQQASVSVSQKNHQDTVPTPLFFGVQRRRIRMHSDEAGILMVFNKLILLSAQTEENSVRGEEIFVAYDTERRQ